MVWARPCSAIRNRIFARSRRPRNPFESRTEVWRQVGLGSEIDTGSAQRARGGAVAIGLLIAIVLVVFANRRTLFPGGGDAVHVVTAIALVVLGSALARQLGRGIAPMLMRRWSRALPARSGSRSGC